MDDIVEVYMDIVRYNFPESLQHFKRGELNTRGRIRRIIRDAVEESMSTTLGLDKENYIMSKITCRYGSLQKPEEHTSEIDFRVVLNDDFFLNINSITAMGLIRRYNEAIPITIMEKFGIVVEIDCCYENDIVDVTIYNSHGEFDVEIICKVLYSMEILTSQIFMNSSSFLFSRVLSLVVDFSRIIFKYTIKSNDKNLSNICKNRDLILNNTLNILKNEY